MRETYIGRKAKRFVCYCATLANGWSVLIEWVPWEQGLLSGAREIRWLTIFRVSHPNASERMSRFGSGSVYEPYIDDSLIVSARLFARFAAAQA